MVDVVDRKNRPTHSRKRYACHIPVGAAGRIDGCDRSGQAGVGGAKEFVRFLHDQVQIFEAHTHAPIERGIVHPGAEFGNDDERLPVDG